MVNCAQLLSKGEGKKSSSNITTAFKDTRLMDAVLVLEDFQVKTFEVLFNLLNCFTTCSHEFGECKLTDFSV